MTAAGTREAGRGSVGGGVGWQHLRMLLLRHEGLLLRQNGSWTILILLAKMTRRLGLYFGNVVWKRNKTKQKNGGHM